MIGFARCCETNRGAGPVKDFASGSNHYTGDMA